jgi:hypothetical protein
MAATRPAGGTFTRPVLLEATGSPNLRLAVAPTGDAVADWLDLSTGSVRLGAASAGIWSGGAFHAAVTPGDAGWPSVAIAPSGTAMATWIVRNGTPPDAANRLYFSVRPSGGTWSPPEKLADVGPGTLVNISAAPQNTFWVAHESTGASQIRRWQDGAWQPAQDMPPRSTYALTVGSSGLAADTAETPTLVWLEGCCPNEKEFWAVRRQANGTWPAPQKIADAAPDAQIEMVKADAGGVTAVIIDNGGDGYTVKTTKGRVGTLRLTGGAWSALETVETNSGWELVPGGGAAYGNADSEFAVGADGTAAHAFSDGAALKVRVRRNGVWGAPQTVSVKHDFDYGIYQTGRFMSEGFDVAVAPDGHAEVVFTAGTNPPFGCAWREGIADLPPLCSGVPDAADRDGDGFPNATDPCPDARDPLREFTCTQQGDFNGCTIGCSDGSGPGSDGSQHHGEPSLDAGSITVAPRGLRIRRLLKAGRHRLAVELPGPGTLEVKWLKGRTVVASGSTSGGTLTMKLTRAGRKLLKRAKKPVRLVAKAGFRTPDGETAELQRPFSLKR